jgi:two-component system response regulator CpxR
MAQSAGNQPKILVIDDDSELIEMLGEYLAREGYSVDAAHDGDAGLKKAAQSDWTLIILDVMLPKMNGFEVVRRLRASGSKLPVLILSARGEALDRVVGLQSGADDYLAKPFDPQELVARVQAILRRTSRAVETGDSGEVVSVSDVVLDSGSRTVRRGGVPVEVTAAEFSLLRALMLAAGRVVERRELARDVMGREISAFDRSIDNHVSSLRRKLGPSPEGTDRIRSIRNAGYVYVKPESLR